MVNLRRLINSKPMGWLCKTLAGNVCLCWVLIAIPTFIAFLHLSYVQHIFTVDRALYVGLVCVIEGGVVGFLIWLIVTRPNLSGVDSKRRPRQ